MGAWLAKEMGRDIYLNDDVEMVETLLARTAKACSTDPVPESKSWQDASQTEILNHHKTLLG